MKQILKRTGEDVLINAVGDAFPLKINTQYSAITMLGALACPIRRGEKIDPPWIISRDGEKRDLIIKWTNISNHEEEIKYRLLLDPKAAEKRRWEVVQKIKNDILPAYKAAWAAVKKVGTAYLYRTKQKSYAKYEYSKYSSVSEGVSFQWVDEKPIKVMHEDIARKYEKEELRFGKWNSKLNFGGDVLEHAIFSICSRRMDKNEVNTMTIFNINGHKYMYLRNSFGTLNKFFFPSYRTINPIEEVDLPDMDF